MTTKVRDVAREERKLLRQAERDVTRILFGWQGLKWYLPEECYTGIPDASIPALQGGRRLVPKYAEGEDLQKVLVAAKEKFGYVMLYVNEYSVWLCQIKSYMGAVHGSTGGGETPGIALCRAIVAYHKDYLGGK